MKSSYSDSGSNPETCVNVDLDGPDDTVLVKDSKDPDGPVLVFNHAEWEAFLAGAKDGEFDFGGV